MKFDRIAMMPTFIMLFVAGLLFIMNAQEESPYPVKPVYPA